MPNRDLFHALERLSSRGNIVHRVKNFCTVVSGSAGIANTYHNPFEDDETLFVLKGLPVNFLRTPGAFAALAWVVVGSLFSGT